MLHRSRSLAFRHLIYTAMGFVGVAVVAIGLAIWAMRSDSIDDAASDTQNVAIVLAEQMAQFTRSVDLLFADIQERIAAPNSETTADFKHRLSTQQTYFLLRERSTRLPQIDSIELISADGEVVNSTRTWPTRQTQVLGADDPRPWRNLHKNELHVGAHNGWTVYVAKGFFGESGELVGSISIGINFRYFQPVFDSMAALSGQFFMLLRRDGSVLVRYPEAEGRNLAGIESDPAWQRLGAGEGGSFRTTGPLDRSPRWIAVRSLSGFPFAVAVGFSEAAALEKWERRATYIVGGTLLAALCSMFLLRALVNQFHHLLNSEVSLSEREGKLAEKTNELELVNEKLDAALNNMSQGLCMFDKSERLVVCNDRYLHMYGLSPETVYPGCTLHSVLEQRKAAGLFAHDVERFLVDLRVWRGEKRSAYSTTQLKDGRIIAMYRQPILGGGWISTHEDVTERQRSEARIAHMARHDPLTDLGNRTLFREDMDKALARLRRREEPFCILLLDLDLFKTVNDSLGHPVGDTLLKSVAQRLLALVRETDTVARLGGDEFAILQTCCENYRPSVITLAERVVEAFAEPYEVDGHQITLGVSIGIAIAPDHGCDAGQLLKNADLALYRAKSEGRNCYRFFEAGMDVEARLRRELEVELRHAISRGEFQLHYQSLVDIGTQRICGVEALVRWIHPTRGLILPDKFIPLAEEIGLVIPIGEWIVRKACMDAAQWPSSIKVAVNLSAVQFRNGNLLDIVTGALTASGLSPSRLELEITESVLLQKSENNIAVLHQLKQLGVSIVLDDFGTGYSSLSYLRMFPFNKIKIDRSFVAEMLTRNDCAAIVCAIVALGKSLDIETTAEGVETSDQLKLLRAAGCAQAQGYLFSRPCAASDLSFIKRARQRHALAG